MNDMQIPPLRIVLAMAAIKQYSKNLEQMIAQSSKEDLAECAHLLALNVAICKGKHRELLLPEPQAMLEVDDIYGDMATLLAKGMLEMTMTLAVVTGRSEEYARLKAGGDPLQ